MRIDDHAAVPDWNAGTNQRARRAEDQSTTCTAALQPCGEDVALVAAAPDGDRRQMVLAGS
jgi:hypothetical protein